MAYENQEKFDLAKADFEQALKIDPDFTPAKNNLAALIENHPNCPRIFATGDIDAPVSSPILFTAQVEGGDPSIKPTFKWYVSRGKISSGQGTSAIRVDTTGVKAGESIIATLDIGGLPKGCMPSSFFSTDITSK